MKPCKTFRKRQRKRVSPLSLSLSPFLLYSSLPISLTRCIAFLCIVMNGFGFRLSASLFPVARITGHVEKGATVNRTGRNGWLESHTLLKNCRFLCMEVTFTVPQNMTRDHNRVLQFGSAHVKPALFCSARLRSDRRCIISISDPPENGECTFRIPSARRSCYTNDFFPRSDSKPEIDMRNGGKNILAAAAYCS